MIAKQNGTWNLKGNSKEISGGNKKGLLSKLFDKANPEKENEKPIGNALDAINIDMYGTWEFSLEASTEELKELYEEIHKDNDSGKWETTCKNFSKAFEIIKKMLFDTAKETVKEINGIIEDNKEANVEKHKRFIDREIDKYNYEKEKNYPDCIIDTVVKENKNDEIK